MSDELNKNEEEMARALDAKDGINRTIETPAEDVSEMEAVIDSTGLGRVNMQNFGPAKPEKSDDILGWHVLDLNDLPSKGKFYPADTVLKIRSAKAAEIRHFSTMDDNNYIDMEEKLNHIVASCSQMTGNGKKLSYKDILEEDRIILLLSIRDLTFPEPENKLILKGKTEKTKKPVEIELTTRNLVPTEIEAEIEKYYDAKERTYVIQTKSAGEVRMKPPTIGVMEEVTSYLRDRQEKEIEIDKAFIQILPYTVSDWRQLSLTKIFSLEVDYKAWDDRKYMLMYRLAEKMRIGVQTELYTEVDGEPAKAPLDFPGGIKSLFIISDLSGELL
jgi:hypothetical protein